MYEVLEKSGVELDSIYDEATHQVTEVVQDLAELFGFDRLDRPALGEIAGIVRETAEWLETYDA